MEEDGEDWTPFWLENTTNTRRTDRLRQSISSVFFSSGMVVILLLITTAMFFFGFVVPSTVSFIAQIFRPNSVKKSWDSLNIVLVVVGAMFGFLNKITNEERVHSDYYDESQPSPNKQHEVKKSETKASTSDQRYNNYNNKFKGQTANNASSSSSSSSSSSNQWYGSSDHHKDSILRRNSSSYPDLTESSSNSWDLQIIHDGRVPDKGHRLHQSLEEVEILKAAPAQTETIFTDTLSQSKEETQRLPRTIPISTYAANRRRHERAIRRLKRIERRKELSKKKQNKDKEKKAAEPDQAPPLPQKNTKSVDDFFNPYYDKTKKKPSLDDLNPFLYQPLNFQFPPLPSPQNPSNSKKHKRKRTTITVPVIVTPPLNPPPKFSAGESRVPPPPSPGFSETPEWKFVVEGDYVRINSLTSESPGPGPGDVEDSDVTTNVASAPLPIYSSSDVNRKAERFIGNFRAKLKLEKNRSLHKKKVGLSSLGR